MEGREQNLQAGATIGREGCDVNLMDPEGSRRHAAIRDQGGSLAIEDLGSTNGTFVNDTRISAVTVLSDGDVVRLGNTVWAIKSTAPAGATSIGEAQPASASPQVTAARAVPSDIQTPAPQPTTAQQVPAAAPVAPARAAAPPAAAQTPAQPAAPTAAQVGRRGDVDAPPEVVPSAIRRVVLPPTPGKAPVFQNPGSHPGGSAATRLDATIVCMIIVAATAAALVIYFITV